MLFEYVKKGFDFIKSRGISDRHKEDNKLTALLNIISTITSIGAFGIFIVTLLYTNDYVYMIVAFSVSFVYFFMVILHHFHLVDEAKFYFSTVIPFWYVLTMLCIGGNFSQSIAAASTIVIAFLMYKSKPKLRNQLIAFNIIIFVLPTLYLAFYPPFFGVRDYPIDELVVFLLCLGWISIVFSIYENRTQEIIKRLENKNKALHQKTIELERFTYIASHDLKSPLRNISSFLGLIRREINREKYDNIGEYLGFAEQGANQMNKLIKGVLEVSTIEYKTSTLKEEVNLNTVLNKTLQNLQYDISKKEAKIVSETLPTIIGNESDLIILFQNLIQNGIKYNRSAIPQVNIRSNKKPDQVTIIFKDNGIGIDSEYQEQIFEYFKRLHNQSEFEGTGIGLGLCKKVIEKYDGKIFVHSEVDKYSEFHISFPISPN